MSRNHKSATFAARGLIVSALSVVVFGCCSAHAQYVGKVNTSQTQAPTLRATAVLEYTGDLDKPNASRLIPIAVWDGTEYQPGGLYLAQPVPLTVESGTQYILEQAGTPKGYYNVKGAADVRGKWIAVGSYQKPTPPTFAKLHRMHNLPLIADNSKPHFAHVPTGDTKAGATKAGAQNAPVIDPERPTLHHRSPDDNSQANNAPANPGAPVDPNRPIFTRPSKSSANSNAAVNSNQAPETSLAAPDPNRPFLAYGKPAEQEALDQPSKEIDKLSGAPIDLKQMVAVSDAVNRPQHSYLYSWSSPEDEAKMQANVAGIAQQLLAASAPKPAQPASSHARRSRRTAIKKPAAPSLPALTDEHFKAYELAYGAGATFIFSATTGQGDQARYITLIAQPDFNGTPVVLFKQITSERDLTVIPRMKLIDAVDTNGDNRAELIFELENNIGRQYAIYSVANGTAEQVYATGS